MIAMRRCYAISIIGMEGKNMNHNKKKILKVTALFVFMFFLGWGAGSLQKQQMKKTVETVSVQNQADNWGLGFGAEGTQPTGNVTADELKKYNAWYVGDKSKNVIYLTFDCGYENGNTEPILDALKKHNAKATFFVVGHFLESAPDIVKRMEAEGHAVGNHTYHHPDMSSISDMTSFQKEMDDVASLYQTVTGKEMIKYYRPPQGKYSTKNLEMAKELGYHTFFWSLAYVDWKQEEQPTREEAMSKLLKRVHPGAIVLLHNTSRTNGEILDEVLTKWEEMGYHFASLEELVSSGSREARSFFLTDNQENPVKSAAPTHAAGSQKQARGKLTSFMAISAVIMRANSSATPPIIGRKL